MNSWNRVNASASNILKTSTCKPFRLTIFSSILSPSTASSEANRNYNFDESDEQTCKSCLYTGVATCSALSLYFLKNAYLDLPEKGGAKVLLQKRFLIGMSGLSAIAGIYRWHLG
mmetsp:Transcript_18832/g.28616  ORF Transcript_18832/g.28616 Transcript_18832/m.28616 type:complete len:115 (+) Transcript_18832:48-392(+)